MSKTPETLGDAPIEPQNIEQMNKLAGLIDFFLNGRERPKQTGFILMVFPFDEVAGQGRCNYISSANRKDVVIMLKEQLARFEGMPEAKGRA